MITYQTSPEMAGRRKPLHSPWQSLNLLRNPYGECTLEERAQLAIVPELDCTAWLGQCNQPFTALQFMGRCGRGKTTRLLKLHWLATGSHYVYLAPDGRIPTLPRAHPLIIDEAQRLRRKARHLVFASGTPLILGTHRNLARALRAAGYQVTTHHIETQNNASLIHQFASRRMEAARYRAGALPVLSRRNADWLHRKFGSDLRSIESFLYEHMQSLLKSKMEQIDGQM